MDWLLEIYLYSGEYEYKGCHPTGNYFANAVVGAVIFGQGGLALNFTEMTEKEIAVGLLKIWAAEL